MVSLRMKGLKLYKIIYCQNTDVSADLLMFDTTIREAGCHGHSLVAQIADPEDGVEGLTVQGETGETVGSRALGGGGGGGC